MLKKDKKKQIAKISIFITSIFVILLSVTYAFMSTIVTGGKQVVINAGVLDLVLEEENEITISDALPMYDAVGMIQDEVFIFRLVNKTANPTNYILKLQEIETGTLDKSDVKYGLIKEGETTIDLVSNTTDGVIDSGMIDGNDTIDYELRLWIDSTVTDITQVQGKSLSLRLVVEASQEIEKAKFTLAGETLQFEESNDTFPNFKKISSETNGRGIYSYEEDGEDIYYWRGKVENNHVIFAGLCWEMVRTTKTGGIKILYDGEIVDGKCENTGEDSQLEKSVFNDKNTLPAHVGYMNGVEYSKSKITTSSAYIYGNGIKYDKESNTYTLVDTKTSTYDKTTHKYHYTCFDDTGICDKVNYVYYVNGTTLYYLILENGKDIEIAWEEMHSNVSDSTIKTVIENWYEGAIEQAGYSSYIEDAVYCNNKSVESRSGWDRQGNASNRAIYYAGSLKSYITPSLECNRLEDKYTTKKDNGNGNLKYPVGLLSKDEVILAGGVTSTTNNDFYLYTGKIYWLFTPRGFEEDDMGSTGVADYSYEGIMSYGGIVPFYATRSTLGVRPVVSLNDSIEFSRGTGTSDDPFIAPTSSGIVINNDDEYTNNPIVSLNISGYATTMCVSNTKECSDYQPFSKSITWTLSSGDGLKTVYVYFKDKSGNIVDSLSDTINLDTTAPTNNSIQISDEDGLIRTLTISSTGADYMCLSNSSSDVSDCTNWIEYTTTYSWNLPTGVGDKRVYVFFKDWLENVAGPYTASTTCTNNCEYEYFIDAYSNSYVYLMRSDGATAKVATSDSTLTWYGEESQKMKVCAANYSSSVMYIWCIGEDNNAYYKTSYSDADWIKVDISSYIDISKYTYSIYPYSKSYAYLIRSDGKTNRISIDGLESPNWEYGPSNEIKMAVCSGYSSSRIACLGQDGYFYYKTSYSTTDNYTNNEIKNLTNRTNNNSWIDMTGTTYVNLIESDGTNLYNSRFRYSATSINWYTSSIPAEGIKTCSSNSSYNYCLAKDGYLYYKNYNATEWTKSSVIYEE